MKGAVRREGVGGRDECGERGKRVELRRRGDYSLLYQNGHTILYESLSLSHLSYPYCTRYPLYIDNAHSNW